MSKLIDLIKKSGAIRKFSAKEIGEKEINLILEAGVWGLSVLGQQPWRLLPIKKEDVISEISNVCYKKSEELVGGANMILRVTAKTIKNAKLLVAIYNNKSLEKRSEKFGEFYVKRAYVAEVQAIGGAIQNMFLQANEIGLGCVWLDAPTFCSEEVNTILDEKNELIAFLAVGERTDKVISKRSKRHDILIKKEWLLGE